MLLHGIETRDSACSSSICFCFVGWIQNLAVCYGVQHYIASLVSTKTSAKQNIICIFSWMHICVCVCVCVCSNKSIPTSVLSA
jgi:hypothetical protein